MEQLFTVLLIALPALVLLTLLVSLLIVLHFAYPKRDTLENELNKKRDEPLFEYSENAAFEEFCVTAEDGVRLSARLFPYHEESRKFVILCHGLSVNQICASRYIEPYKEAGFNVVTYDHRGHGGSERAVCTLSRKESRDLLAVIAYVRKRFGEDAYIGVQGESMGGATVIGSLRYRPEIRFAVADCPYATLDGFVEHFFRARHLPVFLYRTAGLLSKLIFGFGYSEIRPIDGINNSDVPLLLFHGLNDRTIPHTESEKIIAEYKGPGELFLVEGADHAQDIAVDRAAYNAKVKEFIGRAE